MSYISERNIFLLNPCKNDEIKVIETTNTSNRILIKNWNENLICNIITTNLCQGRTTVIATNQEIQDLLTNKLNLINEKILTYTNEKSINLKKINTNKQQSNSLKSKLNVLSRDIDRKLNILDETYTMFSKKRECGLSLMEIYPIINKKLTQYDEKYNHFITYKDKRNFQHFKYTELRDIIDSIINKNIVDKYIKYRRFSNNKMFLKLKDTIKKVDIDTAIYKISSLLNNEWAFILPMNNNAYNDDFMDKFIHNHNISEQELYELARDVYNKNNITDKKKSNFSKFFRTIFSNKVGSLKKNEEAIHEIYLEYIDNKENLNIFINAFNFLKNIITNDEFEIFIEKLLLEDEVLEYLSTLKNAINIYENFNEVTKNILELPQNELDILDYCYANVEKKEDINELLIYLPEIYLNTYLIDIEESEKNIINNYKEFEYIRDDIIVSMKSKEEFIIKYIDAYWDENYLEISKEQFDDEAVLDYDLVRCNYPCILIDSNNEELYSLLGNYSPESFIVIDESRAFILNYLGDDETKEITLCNNCPKEELKASYNSLQKDIVDLINKMGYECIRNVEIEGFNIDLLVISKIDKKEYLAIEFDKSVYSNADYNVRNDDVYKKCILENNDLSIIRIWNRDWFNERREEIYKLKYILKN